MTVERVSCDHYEYTKSTEWAPSLYHKTRKFFSSAIPCSRLCTRGGCGAVEVCDSKRTSREWGTRCYSKSQVKNHVVLRCGHYMAAFCEMRCVVCSPGWTATHDCPSSLARPPGDNLRPHRAATRSAPRSSAFLLNRTSRQGWPNFSVPYGVEQGGFQQQASRLMY